jgi:hypothetical protein
MIFDLDGDLRCKYHIIQTKKRQIKLKIGENMMPLA